MTTAPLWPVDAHHPAKHRLDAHPREPAELADQLVDLRPVWAHVEEEGGGLLDGPVVAALALAQLP